MGIEVKFSPSSAGCATKTPQIARSLFEHTCSQLTSPFLGEISLSGGFVFCSHTRISRVWNETFQEM
jgi:hypothetical protein